MKKKTRQAVFSYSLINLFQTNNQNCGLDESSPYINQAPTKNINSPSFFTWKEKFNHAISIYSYLKESTGLAMAALT
ncbi:MAG: hypothetical protein ACETWK_12785, partial [Candidatus Aminicenantaceae bacterium]